MKQQGKKLRELTLVFVSLILLVLFAPVNAKAQESSGQFPGGSVKIGYDNRSCSGSLEGAVRYHSTNACVELCDGSAWACAGGGGSGPTGCPSAGDLCSDGSFYAGQVGGNDVYTTAAASESSQTWNDGTTNYSATNLTSATDGEGNTAGLVGLTGNSDYPFDAAIYCDGLNAQGHTDWYLPAKDELSLFWTNLTPLNANGANIDTTGTWYWSSTENTNSSAWNQRFSDSFKNTPGKENTFAVRCFRRD